MEQQFVQLDMEQLKAVVTNAVAEITKQLGMNRVDRKYGVFPGDAEDDVLKMTKDERLKRWLRAVFTKDPAELIKVKALSEGTPSAGGYLVPEEFRTDVIREAEKFGVIRREAFVFPISTDSLNLTAAIGVVTVAWTNEASQIAASDPSFGQLTLAVKKAAGITAMSNELFSDSQFPIVRYLAELFGEAIAGAEDEQAFTGTGSVFTGMLNASGIKTVTASGSSIESFTVEDLLDLTMAVSSKYRIGARFYMHPVVFAVIRKLKGNDGQFIVQSPREANQPATIWGYPVVEVDKMPSTDAPETSFVGFGNARRRCYFADRQQMTVAIGTEGTVGSDNLFEKDMSAVRVTERVGILWTLGEGLARLRTGE
jgi:HK97 family phage major capsid protein